MTTAATIAIAVVVGVLALIGFLVWWAKRNTKQGTLAKDAERLADNARQTEKGEGIAKRARNWLASIRRKRVRPHKPIIPPRDNTGNGGGA